MNDFVVVRDVTRAFGTQKALNRVSFSLPKKGLVGIVGSSGSGKTTLLNILSGIDGNYDGEVMIGGKKLHRLSEARRRAFRLSTMGYVFQNFSLLELETAEMNLMLVLDSLFASKRELKQKKAIDLLSCFGMEKKAKQAVNTLSGGEKQRVALARALCNDPKVLLCDEPTGALDEKNAELVFKLLQQIAAKRLVIVVSHDRHSIEQYCSKILSMKDGKLVGIDTQEKETQKRVISSLLMNDRKKPFRLSWAYLSLHAFHAIKAKKWRALVSEASIALGLCGFGLATYISTSISQELDAAFSSIVPPSVLVMSPRNGAESPLGAIYGAGFEECEWAVEEYGDLVMDYGSDLHLDYEAWFKDANYFTISSGSNLFRLEDFSMRSINDFQWLDTLFNPVCYPRYPAIMYDDQVILGLPYASMYRLCLSLHVLRNYQALGEYVDSRGLDIVLNIANEEYSFDDQEIFSVIGVVESDVPCFYHLDHRWNRKIIVDQMRFRTSITEATLNPQYIFEIPFLALNGSYSEFLHFARVDPVLEHLLFEPARNEYLPTVCPVDSHCSVRRLYLYGADKSGVSFLTLDECQKACPSIVGRTPVTSGSYYAQAGSLAMGFSGKFFLCKDGDCAEKIVDFYSDLPLESAFLPGEEIPGTKDGSYLLTASGGVRLSTDLHDVEKDSLPSGVEECLLSTSLYHEWGEPKEIYVAAEIGADATERSYERDFGIGKLKVVGTKDAPYDTFFVNSDWSVDYYFEVFGMSSFSLEPIGAVFAFASQEEAEAGAKVLTRAFPSYLFSSPSKEVSDSIASTLGYVGKILTAFSFIALSMSALLFLIVMTITVSENESEAVMMETVGISRVDIIRSYYAHTFLYAGVSTASSLLMLLFSEFVAKSYIASYFRSQTNWTIPWEPLAATCGASIVFVGIILLGVFVYLWRKKRQK